MLNVFITLAASVTAQLLANSDFVQIYIYDHSYLWYKLTIACIYLSLSLCCVKLAVIELDEKRNYSAMLISILCLCMLITAMFNVVMINSEMFYLLTDYKSGDGFSWKNIYRAVEIITTIIVGTNGLKLIYDFGLHSFFISKRANNINQSNFEG